MEDIKVLFNVINTNGDRKILADAFIKKGTPICSFTGRYINYQDTLKLGDKESFALQIGDDNYLYLDPPARYFNHSCEPNCGLTLQQQLIAIQDIKANEELRWDYSTSMLEKHWTMDCVCKTPNCRKVIRDFDTLPPNLQKKYLDLNIVQDFIKEKAGSAHDTNNVKR
jgi:uncharacterized protein